MEWNAERTKWNAMKQNEWNQREWNGNGSESKWNGGMDPLIAEAAHETDYSRLEVTVGWHDHSTQNSD